MPNDPDPWGFHTTDPFFTYRVTTSDHTMPYAYPLAEEDVRRIVREEMADAPFKVDVPDGPPEA